MRDRSSIISEKGCLRAGEEWIEGNFLIITMSSLALACLQVFFGTSLLYCMLFNLVVRTLCLNSFFDYEHTYITILFISHREIPLQVESK